MSKYRLKQITKNGRYAALCRTPLDECPFKDSTPERLAWVKGWWQVGEIARENWKPRSRRDLSADIENAVYAGVIK